MFAMFVDRPHDIERPQRRGEREPDLWRELALLGLIALAGVTLSLLAVDSLHDALPIASADHHPDCPRSAEPESGV